MVLESIYKTDQINHEENTIIILIHYTKQLIEIINKLKRQRVSIQQSIRNHLYSKMYSNYSQETANLSLETIPIIKPEINSIERIAVINERKNFKPAVETVTSAPISEPEMSAQDQAMYYD